MLNELVVNALLNHEPCRRDTHLTGVSIFRTGHNLGSSVHIRIVEHDHWRMSAKLHGRTFHVQTCQCGQLLAYVR